LSGLSVAGAGDIRAIGATELDAHLDELAEVLRACVHAGAAVNFVLPFEQDDARAFWRNKVAAPLAAGKRIVLVAKEDGRIAGTVQLDLDTPPNQPHRADVTKLLVHPDFRRRGIGGALMRELERRALAQGRTLLTLDTRTGAEAEPLYRGLGYREVGTVPNYARNPTDRGFHATTIFYKTLA
jgi:ribosomal protein S18 acetylase RimI-like enzyme